MSELKPLQDSISEAAKANDMKALTALIAADRHRYAIKVLEGLRKVSEYESFDQYNADDWLHAIDDAIHEIDAAITAQQAMKGEKK